MNNTFSERLKKAMNIRRIKQVELVEKTGISKSAISQYLSGAFVPKQDTHNNVLKKEDKNGRNCI